MTVDENSLIWKWSWKIRFSHFLKAFYFPNRDLVTRLLYVFLNNIFVKLGQWNNSYGLQMLALRSVLLLGIFLSQTSKMVREIKRKGMFIFFRSAFRTVHFELIILQAKKSRAFEPYTFITLLISNNQLCA